MIRKTTVVAATLCLGIPVALQAADPQTVYDANGNIVEVAGDNGTRLSSVYDRNGKLVSVRDQNGLVKDYQSEGARRDRQQTRR